jgi:hypothetical protein
MIDTNQTDGVMRAGTPGSQVGLARGAPAPPTIGVGMENAGRRGGLRDGRTVAILRQLFEA